LEYSPIRGPEGNIEYLMYLKKNSQEVGIDNLQKRAEEIVEQAHQTL
jgi:23S rRNA (cytidine1920-2'-O)/16S rRNA (cytidine1409-2'-O)-methyltransferase